MKKKILFFFIMILLFPTYVYCENNIYEVEELDLSITLPTEYEVFTRNLENYSEEEINKFGFTKQKLIETFESNNIYFDALRVNKEEFIITMLENGVIDLNHFTDEDIKKFILDDAKKEFNGAKITNAEIYNEKGMKYLKYHYKDNISNGIVFSTIYDNKTYTFNFKFYEGEIMESDERRIGEIIRNIKFNLSQSKKEFSNGTYVTDEESNVLIMIPEGWTKVDIEKQDSNIDFKFVSNEKGELMILYTSRDIWEELPGEYKIGCVRSDLDENFFNEKDIADFLELQNVTKVKYNYINYFIGEKKYKAPLLEEYGTPEVEMYTTMVIHINNGWIYIFQINTNKENEYFKDFEYLLNNIKYDKISSIPMDMTGIENIVIPTFKPEDASDKKTSRTYIIPPIISICIFEFLRRKIKKRRKMKEELKKTENETIKCPKCGARLRDNIKICYICGEKIRE